MSPSALIPVQNGMSRVPRSTSSCVSVQKPGHGVVMASARALLTDWAQVARQSRVALDPASLRLARPRGIKKRTEQLRAVDRRAALRAPRRTWKDLDESSLETTTQLYLISGSEALLLDFPISTAHTFCQCAGTRSRTVHRVQPARFFLRSQVSDSRRTSHMAAWQGMLACFEILRLIAQPATTGAIWIRPLYQLKGPS